MIADVDGKYGHWKTILRAFGARRYDPSCRFNVCYYFSDDSVSSFALEVAMLG